MFDIISMAFKYIFIIILYAFIVSIIRLIYLDISRSQKVPNDVYLRPLTLSSELNFHIEDHYPINGSLTIGRAKSNDVVINDKFVSKQHAKIYTDDGHTYFIQDMKSSNGTYVNGNLVSDSTRIFNKDHISIGDLEFVFVEKIKSEDSYGDEE